MNYAQYYGIVPDTNYLFKSHEIDSVSLKRSVKIDHLARILDIDTALLESLNPVYKLKLIPHLENEKFSIILPSNKSGLFITNEDSIYLELAKLELSEKLEYPELTDIEKIRYRVKGGDYLDKIAKKYNCKTSDIMLWNDMKSTTIKIGQRLNIYRTIK